MRRHLPWFILVGLVARSEAVCEASTCHECISLPSVCAWCSTETFYLDNRCMPAAAVTSAWCPAEDIQNPTGHVTIKESNNFSFSSEKYIQLRPQKFNIDLRVGEPQSLNFSYKALNDFPVDIYFLLDASISMTREKEKLQSQSQKIYNTMTKLTRDVFFGLGAYSDKSVLPFNNKVKETAYSFKHELDMTSDVSAFNKTLENLDMSLGENYDNPESLLDGIAQVLTCQKRIKWREHSRKILVFMTNSLFHAAGDGKLAGITNPYDGKCYLDEKGYYYMEKNMDFPSIGQIRKKVADEQVVILFASSLKDESAYNELRFAIRDFFLTKSVTAIQSKLHAIYEQITATVDLRVNMTSQESKHLTLAFEPNCQSGMESAEMCSVEKGKEKHFSVAITLNKYFGKKNFNIAINTKGLKESIVLNINVITNCACDANAQENAAECSNAGRWSCGVCKCLKDKYGPRCNCSSNVSECRKGNDKQDCSGHGDCICGSCQCNKGYGGIFCHYLNDNCRRGHGAVCSDHGDCRDGQCECFGGFTGEACECPTSSEACMRNQLMCSGRGKCHCGQCTCDSPAAWEVRPRDNFCSPSPLYDSHSQQCRRLIECEECLYKGGDCSDSCGRNMTVVDYNITEEMRRDWNYCSNIRVDFGCYANYSYIYHANDSITMFILHERSCAKSHILIGVMALAVLIAVGLLTLVAWKLLTDARDRKEFRLFQKALEAEHHTEINAIYKDPCTTYQNPAFERHSGE